MSCRTRHLKAGDLIYDTPHIGEYRPNVPRDLWRCVSNQVDRNAAGYNVAVLTFASETRPGVTFSGIFSPDIGIPEPLQETEDEEEIKKFAEWSRKEFADAAAKAAKSVRAPSYSPEGDWDCPYDGTVENPCWGQTASYQDADGDSYRCCAGHEQASMGGAYVKESVKTGG